MQQRFVHTPVNPPTPLITQVNKEYEKYQKQLKAAKKTGSKSKAQDVMAAAKKNQKGKRASGRDTAHDDDENNSQVPKAWSDYQVRVCECEKVCGWWV